MQATPYTTVLSPFEQMLEDLHKAQIAGDTQTETLLRAAVEADLSAREAQLGLCRL